MSYAASVLLPNNLNKANDTTCSLALRRRVRDFVSATCDFGIIALTYFGIGDVIFEFL